MAHILDGTWRSMLVRTHGNPENDNVFTIKVDPATGRLIDSKHGAADVTGQVTAGIFHHITIDEGTVRYRGILTEMGPMMRICGFFNLDPDCSGLSGGGGATGDSGFEQLQEIWIATKP